MDVFYGGAWSGSTPWPSPAGYVPASHGGLCVEGVPLPNRRSLPLFLAWQRPAALASCLGRGGLPLSFPAGGGNPGPVVLHIFWFIEVGSPDAKQRGWGPIPTPRSFRPPHRQHNFWRSDAYGGARRSRHGSKPPSLGEICKVPRIQDLRQFWPGRRRPWPPAVFLPGVTSPRATAWRSEASAAACRVGSRVAGRREAGQRGRPRLPHTVRSVRGSGRKTREVYLRRVARLLILTDHHRLVGWR
jgi:hypothetical protein